MAKEYFEDQTFDGIDFSEVPLTKGDYELCVFRNCQLQKAKLSGIRFSECRFEDCDLSLAELQGTSFQEVAFLNCKMLGLHFEDCNGFNFSVRFENCALDLCVFYQCRLSGTSFINTRLPDTDWTECDLSNAVFEGCDLRNAKFDHTNLENADLREARNFQIDPALNKIRKARFSVDGLPGLLAQYEIRID